MAKLLLLLLPDTETPTTLQAAIAKEKSAAMAGLLAAAQHQPFAAVVQNFVAAHREVFAPLWLEEVRSAVTAHQPSAFFFPAAWLLASSDAPGTLCLLLKQGLVNLRLAKNDAERLQAVLGLTALFKNLAGFGNDAISSSFVQSVLSELPALLARPVDENSPDSVLAHASLVSLLTCVLEHLRLAPLAAFSDDGQPFQGRVASRGLANCCVDPAAFAVEAKEDWGEDDWEEAKPAEKPEKVETKPAEKVETKGMEKPEKVVEVKPAAKERRPRVKPARVVNTGFSDDEAPSAKPTRRRGKKNALLANFVAEDNRAASETPSPTPETMPEAVPEAAKQAEVAPSVPQVAAPLKVTAAGEDDWDEDWEASAKPATPATGEVEWAVEEEGLKAERWSEDEEWVTVEKGGSKNGGDWGDEDWDVEGEVAKKPVEKKEEKPAEKEEEAVKEEKPVEEEKVEEKPEEVKREEKEEEKPEEEKKENPEEMKEEVKKDEKPVEEKEEEKMEGVKEEEKKDVEPEAKPVEEKEEEKEENPAEKKEEKPEEMKEEVKKEEKPKEGEEKKEEVKEEKEYEKPAEKPEEEKTEEMKEEAKEEKPKEGEEKKEEEKEEKPEIVEEKKEETTAEKKEEKEEVKEEKEEETTIEKPVEEKEEVKDERSEEMKEEKPEEKPVVKKEEENSVEKEEKEEEKPVVKKEEIPEEVVEEKKEVVKEEEKPVMEMKEEKPEEEKEKEENTVEKEQKPEEKEEVKEEKEEVEEEKKEEPTLEMPKEKPSRKPAEKKERAKKPKSPKKSPMEEEEPVRATFTDPLRAADFPPTPISIAHASPLLAPVLRSLLAAIDANHAWQETRALLDVASHLFDHHVAVMALLASHVLAVAATRPLSDPETAVQCLVLITAGNLPLTRSVSDRCVAAVQEAAKKKDAVCFAQATAVLVAFFAAWREDCFVADLAAVFLAAFAKEAVAQPLSADTAPLMAAALEKYAEVLELLPTPLGAALVGATGLNAVMAVGRALSALPALPALPAVADRELTVVADRELTVVVRVMAGVYRHAAKKEALVEVMVRVCAAVGQLQEASEAMVLVKAMVLELATAHGKEMKAVLQDLRRSDVRVVQSVLRKAIEEKGEGKKKRRASHMPIRLDESKFMWRVCSTRRAVTTPVLGERRLVLANRLPRLLLLGVQLLQEVRVHVLVDHVLHAPALLVLVRVHRSTLHTLALTSRLVWNVEAKADGEHGEHVAAVLQLVDELHLVVPVVDEVLAVHRAARRAAHHHVRLHDGERHAGQCLHRLLLRPPRLVHEALYVRHRVCHYVCRQPRIGDLTYFAMHAVQKVRFGGRQILLQLLEAVRLRLADLAHLRGELEGGQHEGDAVGVGSGGVDAKQTLVQLDCV